MTLAMRRSGFYMTVDELMSQVENYRILFVCMGNICRSPAGENVMRSMIEAEGISDRFELDSAGTISMHSGNSPDRRMIEAGRARGVPMTGRARHVKSDDLEKFDLILAMDDDNLSYLQDLTKGRGSKAELRLFCEFCTQHEASCVPDPYYGGAAGFEKVLDLLEDGCAINGGPVNCRGNLRVMVNECGAATGDRGDDRRGFHGGRR